MCFKMVPDILPSKHLLSSLTNDNFNSRYIYRDRNSLRVSGHYFVSEESSASHADTTQHIWQDKEQQNDPSEGWSLLFHIYCKRTCAFFPNLSVTSPLLYPILLFIQWGYHWWDLDSRTREVSPLTSASEIQQCVAIYSCLCWGPLTKKETGRFIFKSWC